jgi:mannonate dehydratase
MGSKKGVKLALVLPSTFNVKWKLARQIGVNHAITGVGRQIVDQPHERFVSILKKIKNDFESNGLTIAGLEGNQIGFNKIKLGLPGRDEDIERFCRLIEAMGRVGIPMICYNFMAGIGWYRTKVDIPERGGALTSGFDNRAATAEGLTDVGQVSQEAIWDNFTYFIQRVMPVAEKAGVQMALHPDDPPLSPLRGIGRIFISADSFRKAMELAPSPFNGITFCQANFKAMGEDIEALAREFGRSGKIFFVHFRDIRGTAESFQETFHDNGPTDMPKMIKTFSDVGFNGPIRPDHAPTLEGESNENPGYAMQGKIFAIGYMKGIIDALHIPVA